MVLDPTVALTAAPAAVHAADITFFLLSFLSCAQNKETTKKSGGESEREVGRERLQLQSLDTESGHDLIIWSAPPQSHYSWHGHGGVNTLLLAPPSCCC